MKFSSLAKELGYAIEKCARMTKFKENYPEASKLLIVADKENGVINISATDGLTSTVSYFVRESVDIEQGGKVVVDARSLSVFMSSVFDEVNVYITKAGRVMFKCGAKKISLAQSEIEPFIPVPPQKADLVCAVNGSLLNNVLSISFISDGEKSTIPALAGVLLIFDEGMMYSMVASQGRAAYTWYAMRAKGKGRFLIPLETISLLQQYLYDSDFVDIKFDGKRLWFNVGRFILSTVQMSGNFPYEYIAKITQLNRPYKITVSREELHEGLSTCFRLARATGNRHKRINFDADVDYGLLSIKTVEGGEIGDIDWPITIRHHNNAHMKFSLPSNYLENIVSALDKLSSSDLMGQLRGDDNVTISYGEQDDGTLGPVFMTAETMQALFILSTLGHPEVVGDST